MTCSTSEVAVSCSSASSRSRVSSAIFSFAPAAKGLGRGAAFNALRRLNVLGRCAFCCLVACFVAPSHCLPEGQDKARTGSN